MPTTPIVASPNSQVAARGGNTTAMVPHDSSSI